MALSQDEQRILAEIERRLANDDPGLASSMTAFRRPGPAKMLRRSPRVRIVGSLFAVLLVAMVSLTVYAMIPFRAHLPRQPATPATTSANTAFSAATSSQPSTTQQSSASLSASGSSTSQAGASQAGPIRSAAAASASKPQQGPAKPTSTAILPTANP